VSQETEGQKKGDAAELGSDAFRQALEKVEKAHQDTVADVKAKVESAKTEALKKLEQQ